MTNFDRLEPRFGELMDELAPAAVPGYLSDLLERSAAVRQRTTWASATAWLRPGALRRETHAPIRSRAGFVGVAVVLTVAVGSVALLSTLRPSGPNPGVGGSVPASPTARPTGSPTQSAEDVVSGTFTATGRMIVERERPTATLLRDGRVLIAGGWPADASRTSEVFDPATGQFTLSGDLTHPRFAASAVLLDDGRVLVVGGVDDLATTGATTEVAEAEVWDPATNGFTAAGTLRDARTTPILKRVPGGGVLVSGGFGLSGAEGPPISTAELWDPATRMFAGTSPDLSQPPLDGQVTALRDGRSLVLAHGYARVWDPTTATLNPTGPPFFYRESGSLTATELVDGRVLVVGGRLGLRRGEPDVAEIWDPATGRFAFTGSTTSPRRGSSAVRLADGRVLIVGDNLGSTSAEIFDPR